MHTITELKKNNSFITYYCWIYILSFYSPVWQKGRIENKRPPHRHGMAIACYIFSTKFVVCFEVFTFFIPYPTPAAIKSDRLPSIGKSSTSSVNTGGCAFDRKGMNKQIIIAAIYMVDIFSFIIVQLRAHFYRWH